VNDPLDRSATALAAAIADGELTAARLAEAVLARIEALEPSVHAWAYLDPELVRAQARERDAHLAAGERLGPLHGVPVGIKDIIDTADQPTAHGSPIHAGRRPLTDATVVARLRAAGAVIAGKTVTAEFAMLAPGPTRNPHDLGRTPGGSSSGSAAAVATGMVPLAVGTQTAGSVVRPASFCGVYGAKPTFGRVPTDGVKRCSASLDTVGILARGADDAALALGVMAADPLGLHPPTVPERPRIGFCRTPQWSEVEPDARERIERAARRLAEVADLLEVTLPPAFDGLADAQASIMAVESLEALTPEWTGHRDRLSPELRTYLDDAPRHLDAYDDAVALAGRCRTMLDGVFDGLDALLAPSVLGEAPDPSTTGDPLLCRIWTLLGTPAVAVPGLTGAAGLPLGVQVVGARGDDTRTLAVAGFVGRHLAEAQ
jgi:Asp-tRNA(Asn)/Glu-tRNA(Gln) amidotransferase A subunit family amidase